MPLEGNAMITNITLENFKCFRKLVVDPRLITVFIGPNGSGKSSVLQAMALLKQSIGSNGIRFSGDLINLEGLQDILPKFTKHERSCHIGFGGTAERPELADLGFGELVQFRYVANVHQQGPVTVGGDLQFQFENEHHLVETSANSDQVITAIVFGRSRARFVPGTTIAKPLDLVALDREDTPPIQAGIDLIINIPNFVLNQLRFVNATRGLVQPRYRQEDQIVDDVSLLGGLTQQERQTATNLVYSRSLENRVSSLIEKVTGVGLRADTIPPQSIAVKAVSPVGEVNVVSEGFGTNALILLSLQMVSSVRGATVMIEEPEIHLHPKAQAKLASVLVEEAQAENKQLMMTTHSEHILGRLLTLVAENKLDVDELAIYAFEKDEEGVCTAERLEVAADGRVKGGLKDFFESHLDELNRYVNALQTRE